MKTVIHPNFSKANCYPTTSKVCFMLKDMGFELYSYTRLRDVFPKDTSVIFGEEDEVAAQCDMIIAIGGDGTIIEAAHHAIANDIPILGINTGRLGFMAAVEYDELYKLSKLMSGDYTAQERLLVECEHTRCAAGDGTAQRDIYTCINDVVLSASIGHLIDFAVRTENITVSKVRADGIIFSPPTGSTAYALSAGGPILSPDLKCIQMTPVCPHSLSSRPMIFSPDKVLSVSADISRTDVFITVDGKTVGKISANDSVIVRRSPRVLKLIDIDGDTFYDAVNRKLLEPVK